ncbi:transporter substrate-binding domain-containing protein [Desulfogranum mediterraneum]|uniref:transporter substrate-binding domain-containing protein n=1 Tax=Desulfogranum mediterraneum TaxID=160661 RepID=UPI0003F4CF17|nr:transporter substrate-binding domain-containing protein [Desulfogranum mediterraneum]
MKTVSWFVSAFFLVCALTLVSPAAQAGQLHDQLVAESTIEQIVKRGTIKVGMDIFVPYAMKDKTGRLIGLEIDVARQLAADMGVEVEFVPTKWSGIIPALVAGKFDVIIGGMTVTPKRNIKINFTNPYYYTSQGLLANTKMSKGFTLADFNDPKVTIAARLGSTAAVAAKANFPKARLRLFDDEPAAVQEVRNGRVHAMVGGQPLPAHMAAESPQLLHAYSDQLMKEPMSFAVRKGDVDTLNFFNNWIEVVRSKGWVEQRYHYWFETTEWKKELQ